MAQRTSILNRADRLLVLKEGMVSQFGDRAEVLGTLAPRRSPIREGAPQALPAAGGRR